MTWNCRPMRCSEMSCPSCTNASVVIACVGLSRMATQLGSAALPPRWQLIVVKKVARVTMRMMKAVELTVKSIRSSLFQIEPM